MGFVPDLVTLSEAACNDKTFPGQLEVEKGAIYRLAKVRMPTLCCWH